MTNPITEALTTAHEALRSLDGERRKQARATLTEDEARQAGVLIRALIQHAWVNTDTLRWYYEDGPGGDEDKAAALREEAEALAALAPSDGELPPAA